MHADKLAGDTTDKYDDEMINNHDEERDWGGVSTMTPDGVINFDVRKLLRQKGRKGNK